MTQIPFEVGQKVRVHSLLGRFFEEDARGVREWRVNEGLSSLHQCPRPAWVVGFRYLQTGVRDAYPIYEEEMEYEVGYLRETQPRRLVALVAFSRFGGHHYAAIEDLEPTEEEPRMWTEKDRQEMRDICYPRDEKGRFV